MGSLRMLCAGDEENPKQLEFYVEPIFLIIGFFVSIYSYAIIPDRKYVRLPQEVGLIYKELDVTTKDGYRIETWFYPAQDVPAQNAGQSEMLPYKTIDDSRRPTLIID